MKGESGSYSRVLVVLLPTVICNEGAAQFEKKLCGFRIDILPMLTLKWLQASAIGPERDGGIALRKSHTCQ